MIKKVFLFSLFTISIFSSSTAQKGISFGFQLNSSPNKYVEKIESTNPLCVTYSLSNPNFELMCRIDLTEKVGFKIGIIPKYSSYLTTVSSEIGPKSVQWSTNNIRFPIGFYYTKASENGKYFVLFDFNGMIINKKNQSSSTYDEKDVPFQSNYSTNWGTILNYTPRLGINLSKSSKIDFAISLDFQFYGQKNIENSFFIENKTGNQELIFDEIKNIPTKKFNFSYNYTLTYVYKFTKKNDADNVK